MTAHVVMLSRAPYPRAAMQCGSCALHRVLVCGASCARGPTEGAV